MIPDPEDSAPEPVFGGEIGSGGERELGSGTNLCFPIGEQTNKIAVIIILGWKRDSSLRVECWNSARNQSCCDRSLAEILH